jgi:hypothetical protein
MGKRSNFDKIPKDYYRTIDPRAVQALKAFIPSGTKFVEPCAGDGILTKQLAGVMGLICVAEYDIEPNAPQIKSLNALTIEESHVSDADLIISNPPWTRSLLHPMIERFASLRPTWLLFDSSWPFTKQSSTLMEKYCTDIVAIGRLKWIENTTMSGKDDCSWYRFDINKLGGCKFHGR